MITSSPQISSFVFTSGELLHVEYSNDFLCTAFFILHIPYCMIMHHYMMLCCKVWDSILVLTLHGKCSIRVCVLMLMMFFTILVKTSHIWCISRNTIFQQVPFKNIQLCHVCLTPINVKLNMWVNCKSGCTLWEHIMVCDN